MVGKKKVPKQVVTKWEEHRDQRMAAGASVWKVAKELSLEYSYSWNTIYYYLRPQAREAHNRSTRESQRRRTEREIRRRGRIRHYRRITRNPERYLFPHAFVFVDDKADIATITQRISDATGVHWKPTTIEKILRNWSNRRGDPPYLYYDESSHLWRYSSPRPESYPDQSEPDGNDPLKVFLGKVAGLLIGILGLLKGS